MRSLLLIPLSIVTTAAGGFLICISLGTNSHALELSWAAGAILIACIAGVLPL